jgi:hypothetical protein
MSPNKLQKGSNFASVGFCHRNISEPWQFLSFMPVEGLHQNLQNVMLKPFKKIFIPGHVSSLSSLWAGGRECSLVKTGKSLESINMAESGYLSDETAGIRH